MWVQCYRKKHVLFRTGKCLSAWRLWQRRYRVVWQLTHMLCFAPAWIHCFWIFCGEKRCRSLLWTGIQRVWVIFIMNIIGFKLRCQSQNTFIAYLRSRQENHSSLHKILRIFSGGGGSLLGHSRKSHGARAAVATNHCNTKCPNTVISARTENDPCSASTTKIVINQNWRNMKILE